MQKKKRSILSLFSAVVVGIGLAITMYMWLDGGVSQVARAAPLATTWYVDLAGDDGNSCTSAISACQTVGAAVSKAAEDDAIMVAAGVYTENLIISKDLTIIGAGRESTILDGNQAGRVIGSSGQLTLQDLTIRNGLVTGQAGGGIFNSATLTLSNTLIVSNTAAGSHGGGIHNQGVLLLQNSAVVSNTAASMGSGIYNYSSGVMTITSSLIAGNDGVYAGGGVYNDHGHLVITNATIRDNSSNISGAGGGGIYAMGGTVVLSATTIHGNDTVGIGGGIYSNQAVFTITNSTISGNAANNSGGIYIAGVAQTSILNSTIAYNQRAGGNGGGIWNSPTGTIHLKNSIVANNEGTQCSTYGTWVSEGHNLSSDDRCDFTQTGDLESTDPLLAPLADYGGSTPTHALLPGSPVIDSGDNTGCPATDQRGVSRPVDGDNSGTAVCDIGSYEARNQITISDVSIAEGDSGLTNAILTVTLTPTSTQAITVDYTTADGTAVSGDDFNAISGTVTFGSGQSTQFITVTVNGDVNDEADETFTVNLSNAQVADLLDSQATGTIVDDDGLPSLVITDQMVDEGDSGSVDAVFEVTLSPVSASPVTVDYTTTDGTAVSGSDYTAVSGTLTFTPGETSKTITVTVSGDLIDEGDSETFTVDLSAETNASLADGQGVGTILDDDLANVSMTSDLQIIEGGAGTTSAVFTVTLSTPTAFTVTMDYTTIDGVVDSAEAGSDYEAISGTLTFAPGETTKLITVNVYGDTIEEPDESFGVRLSNVDPLNVLGGTIYTTIINDDFQVYLPLVMK
ncbi:MAG: Calx-beta domain-containing protein [Anaerolineae bacterium]